MALVIPNDCCLAMVAESGLAGRLISELTHDCGIRARFFTHCLRKAPHGSMANPAVLGSTLRLSLEPVLREGCNNR